MGCNSSKVQVGDSAGLKDPSYDDTMKSLMESIDEMIASEGYEIEGYWFNLSKNGKSDLMLFKQHCEILSKTKSMSHEQKAAAQPGKDPNKQIFKLQKWVKPTDLRPFLTDYEVFDTSLDQDGDYSKDNKGENITDEQAHEDFMDYVKLHHDGVPFDTEMQEGETAWKVLDPDIFAKDEITESQRKLIKIRERRKDMGDIKRMKQHRKQIATYFVKKRKFTKQQMKPYLNWSRCMMNSYLKFLELC